MGEAPREASPRVVVECAMEPAYPFRPRFISPTTFELTGYTTQEYLEDPTLLAVRLHPDDFARVMTMYHDVVSAGTAACEYRFMHKGGGYRWLRDELTMVRDDAGEPSHIAGRTWDVTSRRTTEAALVGREEYFRRLIEHASDVFVVIALDGTIRYESPSVRRLAGFTSDEVIGRNAYDFVHPDDVDELQRQLRLVLAGTHGLVPAEFRHRRADGTWRVVQAAASRLVEDGVLTGAIVNMRDIGDRKRLEEQLQQTRRMEAVGRLAGGVAHDFNNLLTGVLGYAELLLDQLPADSPYRRDVEQIRLAGEGAASVTRQLLAFSRRQLMEPRRLQLNSVVADAATMLRRVVGEEVALETDLDPTLGAVHADQGQLEQTLADLSMNSREAMLQGGLLTIRTKREVLEQERVVRYWTIPPGSYAVLSVADTGVGMIDNVLRHIFEPFFSTKPRARGTGLGLASVYGIVAQSGGYMAADSTPGAGTVVSIYLPEVPSVVPDPDEPEAGDDQTLRGSATVLLVEDNDLLSTFAHSVLRSNGYHVLAARNADEAEEHEAGFNAPIDLLLTDVVMPGRSGVALAERITRRRPGIQCLYMSGYNQEALLRHGVVAGTVAFLAKPFTARGLLKKVRQTLAGRARAPADSRQRLS